MYAGDNLSDAFDVTKRYLSSLSATGWLKIALVVLLISGIELGSQLFDVDPTMAIYSAEGPMGIPIEYLLGAIGLAAFVLFRYLSALFEFVFLESLRSEAIHVRRYARANLRHGLWLVLFRAALWTALLLAIATPVLLALVFGDVGDIGDLAFPLILSILFVGVFGYVVLWVVYTLTTAFVVPVMALEDRGPIGAWRTVAATIRSNVGGTAAFLAVAWVIGFCLWVVFAIGGFFVSMIGLLVFGLPSMMLLDGDQGLAILVGVAGIVAYLVYLYIRSFVEAPVRSYVRYYALLILGDTDGSLDLIPDQRRAVRSDRGTSTGGRTHDGRRRTDGTSSDDPTWGSDRTDGTDSGSQWSTDSSGRTDDPGETRSDRSGTDGDGSETWSGPSTWEESTGWDEVTDSNRSTGEADDSSDDSDR
ncbi:DUF7544 domain-containing protein [Natrialba swarupiae]|uniref:Uncharacterized protein n=1 Tax=Natrialba swarupiae TaxID=2448032 RepID=A0A5D5AP86_9EURY|nr:hypothetical protein [Natrialba swarupiae]TYT63638.1 hypothetical protein FYC77_03395 [Natrialba swarupiae]